MLTLILFASLGAYLSRRVNSCQHCEGATSIVIDHNAIASDFAALWTFLIGLCNWAIGAGRSARNYWDLALVPWLDRHGLKVPQVPAIDLPRLPEVVQELPQAVAPKLAKAGK